MLGVWWCFGGVGVSGVEFGEVGIVVWFGNEFLGDFSSESDKI